MNRKVCIHCHFYQPPRENPWLEDVEMQDSAYPFHDWNERITDECYRSNAVSRILDADGRIADITNNYSRISFNFGPTLLHWMEKHMPEVYQRILDADRQSQEFFGGHGAAIAQVYNHMILPLANSHDKWTQVAWGIEDFRRRFKRFPEGMWLAETAVDLATLETLARNGIRYTILAPHQAARVRKIGTEKWHDVDRDTLDTRRAYLCRAPSGDEISLFFYQGTVAQRVAYGNLILNGDLLANELLDHFDPNPDWTQLVHIATDGETYGHHYRYGDMALAYCLHYIESTNKAELTIYGQFLDEFPPEYEVQINENTSWSCSHGIERWKNNCGCATDPNLNNKQHWRAPLRMALDWLRDQCASIYEQRTAGLAAHPWLMRDAYIRVINDRLPENINSFFGEFIDKPISEEFIITLIKVLEIQRNAMLMFTSCGWFFNDISGLETTQILRYAARAIQLAKDIDGRDLEPEFMGRLEQAPCNLKDYPNGKVVYEKMVKPSLIDLHRVAAHLAISKLFGDYTDSENAIYCYTTLTDGYEQHEMGMQKLAIGRTDIRSDVLTSTYKADHMVLYFGGQNLSCAVSGRMPDDKFRQANEQITSAFKSGNTAEVVRLMNVFFGEITYSLWHLFRDALYKILYRLLHETWEEIDASFRHIYETNFIVMKLMRSMQMVLPKPLAAAAEFVLSRSLVKALNEDPVNLQRLQSTAEEIEGLSIKIDEARVRLKSSRRLDQLMQSLVAEPENLELLQTVSKALEILLATVPHIGLQETQNAFFETMRKAYEPMLQRAESGDQEAVEWVTSFSAIADYLKIAVPQLQRQK